MDTYAERGELEPHDEESLESEVPWEVVQHSAECKAFEEVEETENDPVGEPLDVVVVSGALDRLHGKIRGKGPAKEVGNRRGERVDRMKDGKKNDANEESISLGNLSALFKGDKGRILVQL